MKQKQLVREKAREILEQEGTWVSRDALIEQIKPVLRKDYSLYPARFEGLLRGTGITHRSEYKCGKWRSDFRIMGAK